jgi:adenylate cyclase class 2
MQTEIEAKFLDIDVNALRERLISVKAKKIHDERLMRRWVFDYPDKRLEKIGGWVRVREEGDKVTLSYKQLNDRTLHGTKEVVITVDSSDETQKFLSAIGLVEKAFQETKRERWELDECEITIDTWPWIPAFVEIEAPSESKIKEVSEKLGFEWAEALFGSVETAYQRYFDLTEEEIDAWPRIVFEPTPDWLLVKQR